MCKVSPEEVEERKKTDKKRLCVCFVDIALFFFFLENEFPREFSQVLLVPCRYKQCVIAAYYLVPSVCKAEK